MTKKERQDLVAAIEAGRYKSKRGNGDGKALLIVGVVMLSMFFMPAFIIGVVTGGAGFIVLIPMILFMMFPIGLVALIAASANRGADLGVLTPQQRHLILEGKKIDAHLDAIEQKSNLYTFRCSADYAGYTYHFVSPTINVEPIAASERTIPVFIDEHNPNLYVVDIYSRLPIANNGVLQDRSEMQIDKSKKMPNQNSAVVATIIVCIYVVPAAIFSLLFGLGQVIYGNPGGLLLAMFGPAIAVLAIWGVSKAFKKNKDIAQEGCYIPATAQRFWVTRSKNSTTYHLSARYIEPSTKIVHDFQTSGPSSMRNLVGAKVNTFINPDDTSQYYMDVQSALKTLGFTVADKTK